MSLGLLVASDRCTGPSTPGECTVLPLLPSSQGLLAPVLLKGSSVRVATVDISLVAYPSVHVREGVLEIYSVLVAASQR